MTTIYITKRPPKARVICVLDIYSEFRPGVHQVDRLPVGSCSIDKGTEAWALMNRYAKEWEHQQIDLRQAGTKKVLMSNRPIND